MLLGATESCRDPNKAQQLPSQLVNFFLAWLLPVQTILTLGSIPLALQYADKMVGLLKSSEATLAAASFTSHIHISPPLGRARLKVVELLAVLLRTGEAGPEAAFVEAGVLPLCLQLFQQFPFNNLLHYQVPN